ncbi:3-keto-disaccharide hydrolase [Tautonia plasticadhaerens]|uniref:3-keto-alpha-glucoside-1,2-lyase/3-keto-2-hydroxy-glucal hydratase domain-containing protein n=1 Tax=Tautonia plasticadhaerens TaxID=2527974 RepID=A0A518H2J3_9BACT|nr:DUF1080 domain-containing protein [Tautonia plasticadhaerens]QDV35040.1 hypothetical protein ElP_29390 [Tautonia plasticadhaerens]
MRRARVIAAAALSTALIAPVAAPPARAGTDAKADEGGWITLFGPGAGLEAFREPHGDWRVVGSSRLDPEDPRHLASEPGSGVMINDPPGRTRNLDTVEEFGDVEVEIEYMLPEGSNAGVKFVGLYEIQMYDSFGEEIDATGNGGVYPRAELLPRYHHIDEGFPPMVNASKAPGEWQVLRATFRAPRFDDSGEKVANARVERAELNGRLIHEDLEVPYPTGHAWRTKAERATGPLFLQADHGPVAFRSVRVRPLDR